MTVNVIALINSLGKTYQEIFDGGLIPYKTKPTGDSGDYYVSLPMLKEGVHLAFRRQDRVLFNIGLQLQQKGKTSYLFPNDLPAPLQYKMTRSWVRAQFGEPIESYPPQIVASTPFGWAERYSYPPVNNLPCTLQFDYDMEESVKDVSFFLTSDTNW